MASTRRHSEKEQQCWRIFLVIFSLLVLGLSIAAICLAQIRNKELFLLLDTYPGSIGLYLGHDLSTGFAAFTIAISIAALVYYVIFARLNNKQKIIQATLCFTFVIISCMTLASGLLVFWQANALNGSDEPKGSRTYQLVWEDSSAWDWMSQTFFFEYGNSWRQLQKQNECCGVRGPHEIGAIRSLWRNNSDIFSVFNRPTECCKVDKLANWKWRCHMGQIDHKEGCFWKVAYMDYIPLAAVDLSISGLTMIMAVVGTHFYVHNFGALCNCFKPCC